MTRRTWLFCTAVAILVVLGTTGCAPKVPGLEKRIIQHDGERRTYRLYVPKNYDGAQAVPLVVALHRFSESGRIMAGMTRFDQIADREGFLVVYPDGIWRRWNSFGGGGRDDVGFILAVIKELEAQYAVDARRIYVTGGSNGGFMSYALLAKAPDVFAAAAPVMAAMPGFAAEPLDGARPIPLCIVHGTGDDIVPYEGGGMFHGGEGMLLVPEAVAFWTAHNQCAVDPLREDLPDAAPGDGCTAYVETYAGGKDGADVVLYTVVNGGHTWPGGYEPVPEFIVGPLCRDFSASEAIWAFFARHALPAKEQ